MKVLLVTPHFPPTHVGGVERYSGMQAAWMADRGHDVDVICIERLSGDHDTATSTVDRTDGYNVHRITLGFDATRDFRLRWDHAALRAWFLKCLGELKPDVMHVHSGYLLGDPALTAAREFGVPVVLTLHDYWFICPRITLLQPGGKRCTGPDSAAKCAWCLETERRRFRIADRVTGGAGGVLGRSLIRLSLMGGRLVEDLNARSAGLTALLNNADVVLSPSAFLRTQMMRAGVPAERISIEPCGVKLARRRTTATALASPLRMGYVGRIVEPKGIHLLIEAAVTLPFDDWRLGIHGPDDVDTRYTARLHRLAGGDPRIGFEGRFPPERLDDTFDRLDVLVIPSIWYENRPFVILEALSAGLIVVASRLGGMAELITHEQNGLLFEPGDAEDLARQLARLRTEPALVARLRASSASVRSHDDEMSAIIAHYDRVRR